MKIGISIRPFNYIMVNRRKELGMTQDELAYLARTTQENVSRIETLKMPRCGRGIRDVLDRIAQVLEVDFELLFPQDYLDAIRHKILPGLRSPMIWAREVDIASLPLNREDLLLPGPEEIVNPEDIENDIKNMLAARDVPYELSDAEEEVLRLHFGIGNKEPKTIEEIGENFGLTKQRIDQIKQDAIRKLRFRNNQSGNDPDKESHTSFRKTHWRLLTNGHSATLKED